MAVFVLLFLQSKLSLKKFTEILLISSLLCFEILFICLSTHQAGDFLLYVYGKKQ
jgi:hypothetical protein